MNESRFKGIKPKPISLSKEAMVKTSFLGSEGVMPLVIQPSVNNLDPTAWARTHADFVESALRKLGAVLFRGFAVKSAERFEQLPLCFSSELLEYHERSTPRSLVQGRVYTSTEYPAHQHIPLHNENSYAHDWPMKLWFFCMQPAQRGGQTPIADSRRVFQFIAPDVREPFIRKQVMYVRNFGEGIDLPWQVAFQTSDRRAVEDYCRKANIDFRWKEGDGLRTRQVCQAVARHPNTGEMVWFNQAHLFHVSSLESAIRHALLAELGEAGLPRNAYYGDGTPVEDAALDNVRQAYSQAQVCFQWAEGDILLLDNMLAAHGRTPFTGSRKVLVAMGTAHSKIRD